MSSPFPGTPISGLPVAVNLDGTEQVALVQNNTTKRSTVNLLRTFSSTVPTGGGLTTYYVSNTGSDADTGLTPSTAWQTIAKVNATVLLPSTAVLFKGGQTFTGGIVPSVTGAIAAQPVIFGSYGGGRATISSGTSNGFNALSLGGIIVRDLIFTGSGAASTGINFESTTAVHLQNIQAINCAVSGYVQWGIAVFGDVALSGYEDVVIEGCDITGVTDIAAPGGAAGIIVDGGTHGLLANPPAFRNVQIVDCVSHDNPGAHSGIVISQTDGGLIYNCVSHLNGLTASQSVGIWTYDSNNVTIDSCTSSNTGTGDSVDGDGFDLDGGCTNCTISNCLSHDNFGIGYLLYSYVSAVNNPNDRCSLINCVSYNDGSQVGNGTRAGIHLASDSANTNILVSGCTVYQSVGLAALQFGGVTSLSGAVNGNTFIISGAQNFVDATTNPSSVLINGNTYFSAGACSVLWNNISYASIAAWNTATGQEASGTLNLKGLNSPVFTATTAGLVPASGGTAGFFLQANAIFTTVTGLPSINASSVLANPTSATALPIAVGLIPNNLTFAGSSMGLADAIVVVTSLTVPTVTATTVNATTIAARTINATTVNATTLNATTGNFSSVISTVAAFSTLNATTASFSTVVAFTANFTTLGATTANFSTMNASVANVTTLNVTTINASTLNVSSIVATTLSVVTLNATTVNASTLNVSSVANITAILSVVGTTLITGRFGVVGTSNFTGISNFLGTTLITGLVGISGTTNITGILTNVGTANFTGGTFGVQATAVFTGIFGSVGTATFTGTHGIVGTTLVTGLFGVVGTSNITGFLTNVGSAIFTGGTFGVNATAAFTGIFGVVGTSTITGTFNNIGTANFSGGAFNVTSIVSVVGTANFTGGTFGVTATSNFTGIFNVNGTTTFTSGLFGLVGTALVTSNLFTIVGTAAISVVNATTINATTINVTTLNVTTLNVSSVVATTGSFVTVNATTVNASTLNVSSVANITAILSVVGTTLVTGLFGVVGTATFTGTHNVIGTSNFSGGAFNVTSIVSVVGTANFTGGTFGVNATAAFTGVFGAVGTATFTGVHGIVGTTLITGTFNNVGTANFSGGAFNVTSIVSVVGTANFTGGTFGVNATAAFTGVFGVVGTSLFTSGAFGVVGTALFTGSHNVVGTANFSGGAFNVTSIVSVVGTATFTGGTFGVNATAAFTGTFGVVGTTLFTSTFYGVVGTTTFTGTHNVIGTSAFTGGNFNVQGTSLFTSTLFGVVGTSLFTGTFGIVGTTLVTGIFNVVGTANFSGGAFNVTSLLNLSANTVALLNTPVLNIAQTWSSGTVVFNAVKLNVTNSTSHAASELLSLYVGGVPKFNVRASSETGIGTSALDGRTLTLANSGQPTFAFQSFAGIAGQQVFGWVYDDGGIIGSPGVVVQNLDDSGVFVANNGVMWRHGGLSLGSITNPGTASLGIVQVWNASTNVFSGVKLDVTNTTSASTSVLIDLRVNAAREFSVDPSGFITGENFNSTKQGLVPASGGATTNFLNAAGGFTVPAGGGVGSGGVSRDRTIPTWDGVLGTLLQNNVSYFIRSDGIMVIGGTTVNAFPTNTQLGVSTQFGPSTTTAAGVHYFNVNQDNDYGAFFSFYWLDADGSTGLGLGTRQGAVNTELLQAKFGNAVGATTGRITINSGVEFFVTNGTAKFTSTLFSVTGTTQFTSTLFNVAGTTTFTAAQFGVIGTATFTANAFNVVGTTNFTGGAFNATAVAINFNGTTTFTAAQFGVIGTTNFTANLFTVVGTANFTGGAWNATAVAFNVNGTTTFTAARFGVIGTALFTSNLFNVVGTSAFTGGTFSVNGTALFTSGTFGVVATSLFTGTFGIVGTTLVTGIVGVVGSSILTGTLTVSGTTVLTSVGTGVLIANAGIVTSAGGMVLLATLSPSNVASTNNTGVFTSAYRTYEITFDNICPATQTTTFQMTVSTTGNAYVSGGYFSIAMCNVSSVIVTDTSTSVLLLSGLRATTQLLTSTLQGLSGSIKLFNPAGATYNKHIVGAVSYATPGAIATTTLAQVQLNGQFNLSTALNGVNFAFNSGNIQTGTIKIYGMT